MGTEMDAILKEFGTSLGFDGLEFDEYGYCCLFFDDIVVNIEVNEKSEQLFLYANIGDIPADADKAFYETLLEANFLFRGTSGGAIGMDKSAGIISLAWQGPYKDMTCVRFEKIIENFVNLTEHWRSVVAEARPEVPSDAQSGGMFPEGIRA
ncbi:MAG: type III secretion system chaperone [Desulfovibrionaceae bacterium]|jgi:hypothetical protein|nr:type III secretion system chaperone [Desulfovibrionaceae bacterium]